MKSFCFALGKLLQFLALLQTATALIVGFGSNDPTLELKMMLMGVLEFFAGTLLLRYTQKSGS